MAIKPEDFFKRIEESGLLNDSIVELKEQVLNASSAEDAAAGLVHQKLLTSYQSKVLVSGDQVPLVIGDYVVTDSIGRGGMGYVLKARHRRMKRQVAIKFLLKSLTDSDDLRRRFEREVEAAAQLNHQNIVTAYDAGVHDGSHYLVMEYVDGEDLSQIVRSSGPMDIPDAVDVIRQAALGLGYAHDRGIVHRDIKPGNLLLDSEGVVRILDMGLARMTPSPGDALEGGAHADLTNTGSVMGTIDYMAPEQALDAKSVDHRADIYALGCTLYFLLTSNPPFRNETVMRRLLAHREQPAPKISAYRPDAPRELDEIFATMMAKSPDDRFPSMKHLLVALDSLELGDSEAEQMATLDVPDDGNGGFVKLPDASDSAISESATSPETSIQSDEEPSTGATRQLPAPDVTILETPSNVSALTALDDAEAVSQAGTSDTDFTGVSETIIGDSHSVAGAAAARSATSSPSWKLIAPFGLAVVALIVFLMTRPEPAAEESSKSAAVVAVPQNDTPSDDSHGPERSETQSPDRRAAEWILKHDGDIALKIDRTDAVTQIREGSSLPDEPFQVTGFYLSRKAPLKEFANLSGLASLEFAFTSNLELTDGDLTVLQGSLRLRILNMGEQTEFTNAGLAILKSFQQLEELRIPNGCTDPGLTAVAQLTGLKKLGIGVKSESDEGLNRLSSLKQLEELVLHGIDASSANLSADGLRVLKQLPKLDLLQLAQCKPNSVFFRELGDVKYPANLKCYMCRFTPEALAELARFDHLKELHFPNCALSDADVVHLSKLTRLPLLNIKFNEITADGVATLRKALPECRIASNHGTFGPPAVAMSPDRRAAEAALKLGGTVWVGSSFQQIADPADLPTEQFVVTKIDLSKKKNIEDKFLANFRGLADLQILILSETSITDRGLEILTDEGRQPLPALQRLYLDGTNVSQTGLQFLSGSHDLIGLLLDNTATTEGAVLDQFPKLAMLGLGYTEFTADELQLLVVKFPWLNYLTMDGRHMSETMTTALANVPELRVLKLRDLPSDFDPGSLAQLPLLTELYLEADDSTVFDDDFWKVIAGLRELHILMCNGVTDQSLAKAPPIPQVEVFIVMSKVVTGEAVAKSMSKFLNVKSLTVNYSDWTDNDIQQLHSLKSLGKLDLTKNSASVEAIKALSASLPKCQIISDHGTFGPASGVGQPPEDGE